VLELGGEARVNVAVVPVVTVCGLVPDTATITVSDEQLEAEPL
jgi:hypothetical protein